ncbi:MAG: mechanosensitive ion channel [Kiloniellales bacterium]|nr:mechanosensitive ion channel [Kiloniellales bacterium]
MEQTTSAVMGVSADLILDYGLDLVAALLLLILGWILAGWAKRLVEANLMRINGADSTVAKFLGTVARYVVLIVVVIAVLGQFGVQTASILAVLGTLGLGIGLALQGTLSNIAAGIMLLFLRPFRVGDYIEAGGQGGTVQEIGLFNTELKTADGIYVTVPNGQIASDAIVNYSRHATRRLDIVVGIGYDDDIEKASKALLDLLTGDKRVHAEPAPEVMVAALADSSVNLNMRCWTSTADYWSLLFDLNKTAKLAVEAAGCSIPFPQHDVHLIGSPAEKGAA